ncbi:Lrp/AsnC family transcriptional regulator [Sandarakinorhabdus oryzae]|uniref:Lrp/AsnC family transcriptional regulator n=1 Tax=Sandarakinorhabdus oryzae TaxID=2675220 RepID=UPI0012E2CF37|nr:Lrp/AsnC family transcriptional regulator [Sandarakinorhabdus oryzae]
MDKIDSDILRFLQQDNRITAAELGAAVGLSTSAANDRLRRLNASGAVLANRAIVAPAALGRTLLAFLFVDLEPRSDEAGFAAAMAAAPDVLEAHHITGPHNWLVKLRVADTAALQRFLASTLKPLAGVIRTETLIVLDTAKETSVLPTD